MRRDRSGKPASRADTQRARPQDKIELASWDDASLDRIQVKILGLPFDLRRGELT